VGWPSREPRGDSEAKVVSDVLQRLAMITRNEGRARRKQALSSSRIAGKTDEMDAVGEAGIDIGEIVADIDDAVLRSSGCRNGAPEDIGFRAAPVGTMRKAIDIGPQPGLVEPEPCCFP
jgi:hypothetical protein